MAAFGLLCFFVVLTGCVGARTRASVHGGNFWSLGSEQIQEQQTPPSLLEQLAGGAQGAPDPYMVFPSITGSCDSSSEPLLSSPNATESQIGHLYGRSYARLFSYLPDFVRDLIGFLLANPFVGVIGLGTLSGLVQHAFFWLYHRLWDKATATLEVSSDQMTFIWLSNWLNAKDWGTCQHVTGVTSDFDNESCDDYGEECWGPAGAPNFRLVPNLQRYGFSHNGQYVFINKTKKEDKEKEGRSGGFGSDHGSQFGHVLTLSVVGTRDVSIFKDILETARQFYIEQTKAGTAVFVAKGGYWQHIGGGAVRKRTLDSVILDEGVLDHLFKDVKCFIGDSKWYIDTGVPYRRGYLLHGPPGCGKTSIISALAGYLDYGVAILPMSDKGMDDETLRELLNTVPQRTILLMEDIDAAFGSRESRPSSKVNESSMSSVTFSGLLNALDGVASADARILFMTTNYVERLDPALIRPGRVDLKQKINYASTFQIRNMFRRFFPNADSQLPDNFVQRVLDLGDQHLPDLSPAQLQGFLLINRADPQLAFDNLPEFLEEARLENSNFTSGTEKKGSDKPVEGSDGEETSGVGSLSRSESPAFRKTKLVGRRQCPQRKRVGFGLSRRRF